MTRPPMAAETEPEIGGIVLAAGEGKRFGGVKQIAKLDGRPLLEHAIRAMLAVPSISPVVVVLGAHAERDPGRRSTSAASTSSSASAGPTGSPPRCRPASPRSARSRRPSSRSATSRSSAPR